MNRRVAMLGLGIVLSSAGPPATAQRAGPQGVIAGQVVDGATGQPLGGATVGLLRIQPPLTSAERLAALRDPAKRRLPVSQQADDRGFFEFSGLAPGPYSGFVERPGYLTEQLGDSKDRPDFSIPVLPVELRPSEQLRSLRLRMWRAGSVAGIALDESGDPVVKATVQCFRRAYVRGRLTWSPGQAAQTDDRGVFHISELVPGTYTVALLAEADTAQAAVFHGGTDSADSATPILVEPGDRHEGITLTTRLAAGIPVTSLAGHVVNHEAAAGRPIVAHLTRRGASSSMASAEAFKTTVDRTGRFAFSRVPKGDYELAVWSFPGTYRAMAPGQRPVTVFSLGAASAKTAAPNEPTWVATLPLSVQEPMQGLSVSLQPGARLSGRVSLAGRETTAAFPPWPVLIQPADGQDFGSAVPTRVEPDGSFRSMGLPPGRYFLSVEPIFEDDSALRALSPVSVRVNGHEHAGAALTLGTADITDISVTLATPAHVSGVVRDGQRRPVPAAHVLIVPTDRARWNDYPNALSQFRVQRTITNRDGLFKTSMLPGSYSVVALSRVPEFWMEPAYLETVASSAARVELRQSASVDVDLTISPTPQR